MMGVGRIRRICQVHRPVGDVELPADPDPTILGRILQFGSPLQTVVDAAPEAGVRESFSNDHIQTHFIQAMQGGIQMRRRFFQISGRRQDFLLHDPGTGDRVLK